MMAKDLWKGHTVHQKVAEPSPKFTQALPGPAKYLEEAISPEEDTRKNKFDVGDGLG